MALKDIPIVRGILTSLLSDRQSWESKCLSTANTDIIFILCRREYQWEVYCLESVYFDLQLLRGLQNPADKFWRI